MKRKNGLQSFPSDGFQLVQGGRASVVNPNPKYGGQEEPSMSREQDRVPEEGVPWSPWRIWRDKGGRVWLLSSPSVTHFFSSSPTWTPTHAVLSSQKASPPFNATSSFQFQPDGSASFKLFPEPQWLGLNLLLLYSQRTPNSPLHTIYHLELWFCELSQLFYWTLHKAGALPASAVPSVWLGACQKGELFVEWVDLLFCRWCWWFKKKKKKCWKGWESGREKNGGSPGSMANKNRFKFRASARQAH